MTENKTQQTNDSVEAFLNTIPDETKRRDSFKLTELMREVTHEEPKMWGSSIVGFGRRHYHYESGREGDTVVVGFSPRKAALTLYLTGGLEQRSDQLARLGKHTTGKGCLYIKKLEDVDLDVLKELIGLAAER
jgi:hypothetical protein